MEQLLAWNYTNKQEEEGQLRAEIRKTTDIKLGLFLNIVQEEY
jgi:hypothetical protein